MQCYNTVLYYLIMILTTIWQKIYKFRKIFYAQNSMIIMLSICEVYKIDKIIKIFILFFLINFLCAIIQSRSRVVESYPAIVSYDQPDSPHTYIYFLFLDVCNIPVIVYYGPSAINYQVTINNVTTSGSLVNGEAKDMNYDPFSRRLFYYNSNNFYSIELDGSDLRRVAAAIPQVDRFIVDGRNNIIYYIHESTDTVYMLNMTDLGNTKVADLADVTGAKDIDIDRVNK